MNARANMKAAAKLMDKVSGADVYVLPEMWSTGFVTDSGDASRMLHDSSEKDVALNWMIEQAQERNAAICGSLAFEREDGLLANRHFFVKPDGQYAYYDKRHLFRMGNEDKAYVRGTKRCVVEFRGVRFMLTTCYDLRFPVWQRNRDDYDVLLCVANWPESRQQVWNTLLRARAIENQCYVVGCNRTGDDTACHYGGGSLIVDAKGKVVADGHSECNAVVVGDINLEELNHFRRKFPVLEDRDEFEIET